MTLIMRQLYETMMLEPSFNTKLYLRDYCRSVSLPHNRCIYVIVMHSNIMTTQSRIIGAVRGAHSQLWRTIIPVCSLYAARK